VEQEQQRMERNLKFLTALTRALESIEGTEAFWDHGPDIVVGYLRSLWSLEAASGSPEAWSMKMDLDPALASAFLNVHAARDTQMMNAWLTMLQAMVPSSLDQHLTLKEEAERAEDACVAFFSSGQIETLHRAIGGALDACPTNIANAHPVARALRQCGGRILSCRSFAESSVFLASGHLASVIAETASEEPDKAMLRACGNVWLRHVAHGEPFPFQAAINATNALERYIRALTIDLVVETDAKSGRPVAQAGVGPTIEAEAGTDFEDIAIFPTGGVVMRDARKPTRVLAGIVQPQATQGRSNSLQVMYGLENAIKQGSAPFNAGDTIDKVLFTVPEPDEAELAD